MSRLTYPSQVPLVVIADRRWPGLPADATDALTALARERPVFLVEPPLGAPGRSRAELVAEPCGPVERVWLEVPGAADPGCEQAGYDDVRAADYAALLAAWLHRHRAAVRHVWLGAPDAHDLAAALLPELLVVDPPVLRAGVPVARPRRTPPEVRDFERAVAT